MLEFHVILIIKLLKFELFLICNSFSRNWLRIIDENDDDVAETDEDYVHYYTDSQIISYLKENDYYKNSIANTIMIRFVSSDEVTETLKTFGVKLYKSKIYFFYPYRDQLPERDDVKTVSEANSTNSRRDVAAAIINSTEDEISAEDFYDTYIIKTCDVFEEYIQHSSTDLEEVNSSLRNFLYEELDD